MKDQLRYLTILALTLFFTLLPQQSEASEAGTAAIIWVDNSGDTAGQACTSAANDCSLRSAIETANATAAADIIYFLSDYTITLLNGPLPTISQPLTIRHFLADVVTIDGNDEPNIFIVDSNAVTLDKLHLRNVRNTTSALVSLLNDSEELIITNSWLGPEQINQDCDGYNSGIVGISASSGDAVDNYRLAVYNTHIACVTFGVFGTGDMYIGTAADGSADFQSTIEETLRGVIMRASNNQISNTQFYNNHGSGIQADVSSHSNAIFGNIFGGNNEGINLAGDSNLIGCSLFDANPNSRRNYIYDSVGAGIVLSGSSNAVGCNWIGVNVLQASSRLQSFGILLDGAANSLIGYSRAFGNVITSYSGSGIRVSGGAGNRIVGNYIGQTPDGIEANPDQDAFGIYVLPANDVDLTIGGISDAAANVIVGNSLAGIRIDNVDEGVSIQRNYFGESYLNVTDMPTGRLLPNEVGIFISDSSGIHVGPNSDCEAAVRSCLYVAHSAETGIKVQNSSNIVIGPNTTVTENGRFGIQLSNVAGGTIFPAAITHNDDDGIALTGSTENIHIRPQAIYGNGGIPIDLNNDGASANDLNDDDLGPNGMLNYPTVTDTVGNMITGQACALCTVDIYQMVDSRSASDGGNYVGSAVANINGTWLYDADANGYSYEELSYTATSPVVFRAGFDSLRSTSEMSPQSGVPLTVSLTASDTGAAAARPALVIFGSLILGITGVVFAQRKRSWA